jgi:hypothetical protein
MAEEALLSDVTFGKVAKAAVDAGVPGFSLYMKNDVKNGMFHTLLAVAAGLTLGTPGVLLVAANSIARANTGRNLWQVFNKNAEPAA